MLLVFTFISSFIIVLSIVSAVLYFDFEFSWNLNQSWWFVTEMEGLQDVSWICYGLDMVALIKETCPVSLFIVTLPKFNITMLQN